MSATAMIDDPLSSTTMLTRLLSRAMPTRTSLQVLQPEHHSNYNGTRTDNGNGNDNRVVLTNIQLRPKQPAALANEIHE